MTLEELYCELAEAMGASVDKDLHWPEGTIIYLPDFGGLAEDC